MILKPNFPSMAILKNIHSLIGSRSFRKWINSIFNKVDSGRIKEVGADRAAAEWLLRCGASVRWMNDKYWFAEYNELQKISDYQHKILEIDATDSCIMHIGFPYLEGLKHLKRIKFKKCIYLEDKCIEHLSVVKDSLQNLEVISCGNVSDRGVLSISRLKNLRNLYLFDLPEVNNWDQCHLELKKHLPNCEISFPPLQ